MSPHFLISQPNSSRRRPSEYLIPEQTNNPLLELVHEAEGDDDDDDYITVLAEDGTEILPDNACIPTTIIANDPNDGTAFSRSRSGRKIQLEPRRKSATRKNVEVVGVKAPIQKTKQNTKKKTASVAIDVNNGKGDVSNTMQSDEFLFDLNLPT